MSIDEKLEDVQKISSIDILIKQLKQVGATDTQVTDFIAAKHFYSDKKKQIKTKNDATN
ncbi:MAG: hypothetical protein QM541_01420 [Flavobacterium sp.]|nr:hypothetical protein [Flavobacterium sp.]